jgi:hypothetical protein
VSESSDRVLLCDVLSGPAGDGLALERLCVGVKARLPVDGAAVSVMAEGMLAERGGLDMDQAFDRLRLHARDNNLRLTDLAHGLVNGDVDLDVVLAPRPGRRPR